MDVRDLLFSANRSQPSIVRVFDETVLKVLDRAPFVGMLTSRSTRGRHSRPGSRPSTFFETASISSSVRPPRVEPLYIDTEHNGTTFLVRTHPTNSEPWTIAEERFAYPNDASESIREDDLRASVLSRTFSREYSRIPIYTIARIERIGAGLDIPPLPDSPVAFMEEDGLRNTTLDNKDPCELLDSSKWSITGQTWEDDMEECTALLACAPSEGIKDVSILKELFRFSRIRRAFSRLKAKLWRRKQDVQQPECVVWDKGQIMVWDGQP